MASVSKVPVVIHPKYNYILTLSEEEAQTIVDICDRIGGGPNTRRRFTNGISEALRDNGIRPVYPKTDMDSGNINFL